MLLCMCVLCSCTKLVAQDLTNMGTFFGLISFFLSILEIKNVHHRSCLCRAWQKALLVITVMILRELLDTIAISEAQNAVVCISSTKGQWRKGS